MARSEKQTPEERARKRAKYLTGLLWHGGTFVIINAFFWILDATTGVEGIQWSFWITASWGLGLAFHGLAYLVDGRDLEERKAEQYLAEGRRHEPDGQ